jgi:hypothetical protein
MRVVRAIPILSVCGVLSAGCTTVASPTSTTGQVVVVGANPAPSGLPGFVINQGAPGALQNPVTCAELVCYQTVQLLNTGPSCVTSVNGQTQVFIAPASTTTLVRTSSSGLLITGNPTLHPGQTVPVNVTIPEQPPVNYVVTLVLNWVTSTCS